MWIISFGRKAAWFTIAYIPSRCLFSVVYIFLTKRRTCVFDRSAIMAFYDIIKNKKSDVKTLIPKISEEFTLVIIWPHQMPGLKGSRCASDFCKKHKTYLLILGLCGMLFPKAPAYCCKKKLNWSLLHWTSTLMSSKSMSQVFEILFQDGDISIFVFRGGVSFSVYVQLKSSFSDEKNISDGIWKLTWQCIKRKSYRW